MRTIRWLTALAALALAACGGGSTSGCNGNFAGGSCGTTGASAVASVILVSDTASIPSDNSVPANFTAYVRDGNNNFVANVPVIFSADTGGVSVTQATTDTNGVAKAAISTLGNKTNRTITVTALADKIKATATVDVAGTTIAVQGPTSLTTGQQGSYSVALNDSAAKGIAGATVTVSATGGVTAGSTSFVTDNQGRGTVTLTGGTSGTGTLTVSGMGQTATASVQVSGNALSFTSPSANTNVPLGQTQSITVNYLVNGAAPNPAATISLATTRGQLSVSSVTTDGSGNATFTITSANAGGAIVTATVGAAASASLPLQFISQTPAHIDVQPSLFTLAPNTPPKTDQQSTISAVVRDSANNLVTGALVTFNVTDVSGGYLTVSSATTDLQGRAQTVYVAGSATSAANGVHVTGNVLNSSGAIVDSKTVDLTVAKRQVFISIGTGNGIVANSSKTQYQKDYIVQVTDSNGAGVSGVALSMSVLSNFYFKGYRIKGTTDWTDCYTVPIDQCTNMAGLGATVFPHTDSAHNDLWGCQDEDTLVAATAHNGILDPGEDLNGNGKLDAGNIALVSPATITTDANGFATVSVFYPEEYAYWVQVTLQAQTQVQGTAFFAQSTFMLPGLDTDFQIANTPPGPTSPFGIGNSCTDTL
jgi:hypothetical protein